MKVSPASGPAPLPAIGSRNVCGIKALTGSFSGTEIMGLVRQFWLRRW
jgi:hypothetical protein